MNQFLHEFRSITAEQWKSGHSRFLCALCQRDYGDPIHCVATTPSLESNWPLVVVIEDCYIPERAGEIVEMSRNTSIETNYAVIVALAVYAELGLKRERLS